MPLVSFSSNLDPLAAYNNARTIIIQKRGLLKIETPPYSFEFEGPGMLEGKVEIQSSAAGSAISLEVHPTTLAWLISIFLCVITVIPGIIVLYFLCIKGPDDFVKKLQLQLIGAPTYPPLYQQPSPPPPVVPEISPPPVDREIPPPPVETIKCPSCGEILPKDSEYCSNCGSKITPPPVETIKCPFCGEILPKDAGDCPNCGTEIYQCEICSQSIVYGDDFAKCPHCGTFFHSDHLLEWLKVKGNCPNCKEPLSEIDIIA